MLAWQRANASNEFVNWEHRDPGNASLRMTWSNGTIYTAEKAELDPLNANAGTADPTTVPSLKKLSLYPGWGDAAMRGDTQCMWDGLELPCNIYADAINGGRVNLGQQRGFNQLGNVVNLRGQFLTFGRFDNAAEYGDSIDAGASPLWVPGRAVNDKGLGRGQLAHHPQNTVIDANRIETLLLKPKCSGFLNRVLAELDRATGRGRAGVSFEDLFKTVRGSIYGDPNWKSRASASPDGILIGEPRFRITVNTTTETAKSTATTVMHEIIHGSPRAGNNYSHFEMADAAVIVGGPMGLLAEHDFPLRGADAIANPREDAAKTDLEKRTINNHNSGLFQALLIQACDRH